MKLVRNLYWLATALFLSVTAVTLAQNADCPTIVKSALAATDSACAETGRNEACYGNISLQAEPQPGVSDFSFTEPGDLVGVAGVQTLTLSPLDQQEDTWGVAVLKLQANIPDTLPGQNVTFLLFGDVEIENAVSSNVDDGGEEAGGVTLEVTVSSMAPIMESFTDTSGAMPKMLNAGTKATADGYVAMAQMLHVTLEDGTVGWIPEVMVTVDGDVSTLPEIDPTDMMSGEISAPEPTAPQLTPMQAFYFKSGANDAPCEEAPDSGILIQTPEGAGKIELVVNDAKVSLGSTGYFQAQAGEEMIISVVEGEGIVESDGEAIVVPAGTAARVPVDENLQASGPPEGPEPYDPDSLKSLPIGNLPRKFAIAPALEVTALPDGVDIQPMPGAWTSNTGTPTLSGNCPAPMGAAMAATGNQATTVTFPGGPFDLQTMMEANSAELPGEVSYSHPEPNLYIMEGSGEGTTLRYEFRVVSETQIDASMYVEYDGCEINFSGSIDKNG